MKTYEIYLKSTAPIQFSRYHDIERLDRESYEAYEERTWREKAHFNDEGYVIIPGTFLKNALSEVAKYLSMQIPGKGKQTFTKHFEAGVLIIDPIILGIKKEGLICSKVFVPSDGKKGAGKRVWKKFPTLMSWEGSTNFIILDEIITKEVLTEHIIQCGRFQGLGTWRPRNGGLYGRFDVLKVTEVK